jgi:hypothetical protein
LQQVGVFAGKNADSDAREKAWNHPITPQVWINVSREEYVNVVLFLMDLEVGGIFCCDKSIWLPDTETDAIKEVQEHFLAKVSTPCSRMLLLQPRSLKTPALTEVGQLSLHVPQDVPLLFILFYSPFLVDFPCRKLIQTSPRLGIIHTRLSACQRIAIKGGV